MSLAQLTFTRPWWLLAIVPLALLVWRLWRAPPGGAAWREVIDAHLLPHLLVGAAPGSRRGNFALLTAGLLLAVLALAGPALEDQPAGGLRRDATRIVMVDLSAPSDAAGTAPPPPERVRLKIVELLRALPEAQTALVVYAGEPYLVVPPTADVDTIIPFVPELAADAMPVPGNRPERALAMAGQVLARSGSDLREIVWITAGAGGGPLPAAPAGVRLAILDVAAAPDAGLAAFAASNGAAYARVAADDADIRALVAASGARGGWRSAWQPGSRATLDLGHWLLLPLLALAALGFRRGLLALLAAPLLLVGLALTPAPAEAFDLPVPAAVADGLAWRRLQSGDAAGAAVEFADVRWRAVAHYRAGHFKQAAELLEGLADADALYNRGNALARHGRLAEALTAYEAALALRPDADAQYNRDLVRRLLNQQESPSGGGGAPPPPAAPPAQGTADPGEQEASRLAEQWLRQVPDEPAGLLRRKLQAEHRRRLADGVSP